MDPLPAAYFDLQPRFAREAARVGQIALPAALLDYTTLYLSLVGNRSFDPVAPGWQAYLSELAGAPDPVAWTYGRYLAQWQPFTADFFGCFYYSYWADVQTIRLHFINNEAPGVSPLHRNRVAARQTELRALFATVRRAHPEATTVRGGSWLYNLPSYQRLFPPAYAATALPIGYEYQFQALWGQFLDRSGQVRAPLAAPFLAAIRRARTPGELESCFPFQMLRPEGPIGVFYAFYRVGG